MKAVGLNHLLYSVSDLERSIHFYQDVFGARLLAKGRTTAYFDLAGIWLALNEEKDIPRPEQASYTHTAFSIKEDELPFMVLKLEERGVNILNGREREAGDRSSVYFTDPDGHKFGFHTGTLADRLDHYKKTKPHMEFFDD
ncbi:metallothiol transferase FosB [Halobacillus litoralis]|uniref:metallothiol transferase FosB n=1 Tax=Halobacillus litoralis TaxID=45668 RepID=UPI001CD42073|nr:metallothiol transferase FosB [Halobacillus litoralis]MCA1022367.1 metallothiol transferase FosB [Halobacillus litoralis]